ncbi:allergen Tha p 1-like [Leptidea sinapis]|uniref:allergen Tha p 1-like n=1 Tax=Leptidea sinapis TaxID=189913 RepID=UPI002146EFFD|nr:allergen Tha p 1-like [Leptidea sinapis]
MKSLIVLFLLGVSAIASSQKYTDRFDNVNVQEILNNKRLLSAYINCVLEKGKCTNEGRELKSHIKDALENQCAKCTEAQHKGTRTVLGHLINREPSSWEQLVKKYDPERRYVHKYEKELREITV